MINYQVEQTGRQDYVMRYSAEPEAESRISDTLKDILYTIYGPGSRIETRREILRPESSGKFRLAFTTWPGHPEVFPQ